MPEIPAVPYLDVLATRNSSSGDLVLFVANRDWRKAILATLRLQGSSAATEARVGSRRLPATHFSSRICG